MSDRKLISICMLAVLAPATGAAAALAESAPERPVADQSQGGVSNLPHARGRTFRTLDAYLAFLREYAEPIDRPWYRQIRPGLYRLERGNYRGAAPAPTFTREQLERRFGFKP